VEFLEWLENTGFSTWVRDSQSIWAYPTILFLHTIGLSLLVGPNVAVALRLLGVGRSLPLPPFRAFFRAMWAGFWINAASGLVLLITDTSKLFMKIFWIKLLFVALGVWVMTMIRGEIGRAESAGPKAIRFGVTLAVASLVCWTGAIAAGRLMAYLSPLIPPPGLSPTIP
jgi:hypothetical protein